MWALQRAGLRTGRLKTRSQQCHLSRCGEGQLHGSLRSDSRIHNIEKINARYIEAEDLPLPSYQRVVMDLSFISLKTVFPAVWPFLALEGILVALVKPQFEVGKAIADKFRGVIKDDRERTRAMNRVRDFALSELEGASLQGCIESPIKGSGGNIEYLLGLSKLK